MNKALKQFWRGMSALTVIIFCYLLYVVVSAEMEDFKPVGFGQPNAKPVAINTILPDSVNAGNMATAFPFDAYVQKLNINNYGEIGQHLTEMDTITNSPFLSEYILSTALTSKLEEQRFTTANLDTLNALLNWADGYKALGNLHPTRSTFFNSVHSYWYSYVANQLHHSSKVDVFAKYTFRFKYLFQRCADAGHYPNIGNEKYEKVVFNVAEKNWAYLGNRFWNATSWKFRTLMILLGLQVLLAEIFFLGFCLKQFRKWKSKPMKVSEAF